MFYILIIIAVIIAMFEALCASGNHDWEIMEKGSRLWRKCYRWRWVIGLPFVVLSFFISYPLPGKTGTFYVIGFPLAVAARNPEGFDHTGQFTTAFLVVNAVIWYFLPHIILAVWRKLGYKKPYA